jgi:hypothetical protein
MECWSGGAVEFWSVGVLEYWSIGAMEKAFLSILGSLGCGSRLLAIGKSVAICAMPKCKALE